MIPHSALATRFLVAALALFACTGCPDDGGSGFGSLKVFIQPRNFGPFTTTDFEANASLKTPPAQPVDFFFSWTVTPPGGTPQPTGNTTRFVDSDDTNKNEIWTVTVTAESGGRDFGPVVVDVPILNSRPTATVFLTPPQILLRECDDLTVNISNLQDADGDTVAVSRIEWFVSGTSVAVDVNVLDESFYDAADPVRVDVTLDDGQEQVVETRPITVPAQPDPCPSPALEILRDPAPAIALAPGGSSATAGSASGDAGTGSDDAAAATAARASSGSALSVSPTHVCSLDPSGALRCEGPEGSALTAVPEGVFAAVATGADYACALGAADGAAVCWGDAGPETGLLAPPEAPLLRLALGLERACALSEAGEPRCWGRPLGEGEALPVGPFVDLDVSDDDYFCAIRAGGAVECWGGD